MPGERGGSGARRAGGLLKLEANTFGENPIFALWQGSPAKKGVKAKGSARQLQRATWSWIHEQDGTRITRTINVESIRGLPSALDMDVLVALFAIRQENRDNERVYFRRREVGEKLGWKEWGGTNDSQVRESLKKLVGTTLWFTDAWYDRNANSYVSLEDGLHLIDGVRFLDQRRDGFAHRGRSRTDFNWARLSDFVLRSLNAGHFNYVDFETYRVLPAGLARRLYLYVAAKGGARGGPFAIELRKLADHMPLTCKHVTALRKSIERAADALHGAGVLAAPLAIDRQGRGRQIVRFEIAPRRRARAEPTPAAALDRHLARFYEMIGVTPTRERIAADTRVVTSLKEQGYDDEDLKYAISYLFARPNVYKSPRSLGILPHVIPEAIKDKKKREADERAAQERDLRADAERVARDRQRRRADAERDLVDRKLAAIAAQDLAALRAEAEASDQVNNITRVAPTLRDQVATDELRRLVRERYVSADELAACEPAEHVPD